MQINSTSRFSSDLLRINDNKINVVHKNGLQDEESAKAQDGSKEEEAASSDQVSKLQTIDAKVRAHEAAHLAAGGGVVTGGANFSYTRGPDGKMYAVGGEVPIDGSEASSPEATIQKARQIAAAAMAPADPSPQDYRVATSAIMMEQRARMELVHEQMERINGEKTYNELSDQESVAEIVKETSAA